MTKHQMKLQDKYYDFIKYGTKRIELRLFDEKRQKIKLGDQIEFSKSNDEKVITKVVGLLHYETFEKLFSDFSIELLADKAMTKQDLLEDLEQFYNQDKQAKFGVLGIKIELN